MADNTRMSSRGSRHRPPSASSHGSSREHEGARPRRRPQRPSRSDQNTSRPLRRQYNDTDAPRPRQRQPPREPPQAPPRRSSKASSHKTRQPSSPPPQSHKKAPSPLREPSPLLSPSPSPPAHKQQPDSPVRDTASPASHETSEPPSPKTPPEASREHTSRGESPRIIQETSDSPPAEPLASPIESLKPPQSSTPGRQSPRSPPASQIPVKSSNLKAVPARVFKKKEVSTEVTTTMAAASTMPMPMPMDGTSSSKDVPDHPSAESEMATPAQAEEKTQETGTQGEGGNDSADGKKTADQGLETQSTMSEKTLDDGDLAKLNSEMKSYAEALASRLGAHDDDDVESYPELDDMGMDEVHPAPKESKKGGIRWAPWNVPAKRRGQTLVVLLHSLSIVATVSLFLSLCANPFAWPLLVLYLLHVLSSKAATDGTLNYRSEWLRSSFIWKLFAGYFPARLHKTHELPATRKYIFGYHPHGIISHGAWAAFSTDALGFSEKFPGITNSLLTLDSNFRVPFYRDYLLAMGMRSVSKESIVNILTKGGSNGEGMGRGVVIVVGGARESLQAQPGHLRLILQERKGFIKIAVRTGADLVPVLAFGENQLYEQLEGKDHPNVHRLQMFILKVWKFTLPFMHGRGIFNYDVGFMPHRYPLNVVVGAPIKVTQSNVVDQDEIDRLHELYVAELEKLWDRYKDEFARDRKEEMQILA